jgi:arginyl-tRNA synthetase
MLGFTGFLDKLPKKMREEFSTIFEKKPTDWERLVEILASHFEKKLVQLNIYYDDLSYTLIEEVAKQDVFDVKKIIEAFLSKMFYY